MCSSHREQSLIITSIKSLRLLGGNMFAAGFNIYCGEKKTESIAQWTLKSSSSSKEQTLINSIQGSSSASAEWKWNNDVS